MKVKNISQGRITITIHECREMTDIRPGEIRDIHSNIARGLIEKGVLIAVDEDEAKEPVAPTRRRWRSRNQEKTQVEFDEDGEDAL